MGFALPDLDRETIDELILSIQEALDEIEPALASLATEPNQPELLNDLFRHLHTIKGNFRMCFLDPFTEYVHEIEDTVSEVRKGRLAFSPILKDALLFGLDKLRDYMDLLRQQGECDTEAMKRYGDYFEQLASSPAETVDALAIRLFELSAHAAATAASADTEPQQSTQPTLEFFKNAALKLDQRLPQREGRTELLEALAGIMLPQLPVIADPEQFYAALYLHDMGLGLIAARQSIDPLDSDDPALRQHPAISHQYLAKYPQWQRAAELVLQHHEYQDGSGFPQGLKAGDIFPGAQLLCLLSDFYDQFIRHHELPERRAVMQALLELSRKGDSCYDRELITPLTQAIRLHFGH